MVRLLGDSTFVPAHTPKRSQHPTVGLQCSRMGSCNLRGWAPTQMLRQTTNATSAWQARTCSIKVSMRSLLRVPSGLPVERSSPADISSWNEASACHCTLHITANAAQREFHPPRYLNTGWCEVPPVPLSPAVSLCTRGSAWVNPRLAPPRFVRQYTWLTQLLLASLFASVFAGILSNRVELHRAVVLFASVYPQIPRQILNARAGSV